jgi:hypothetical protein
MVGETEHMPSLGATYLMLRQDFGHYPANADLETVVYYCTAWILHLFGCILFPDATGDAASWMYIHCLTNWDQAGQHTTCSVGWWLVADGWCWFVLREEYCCLVVVG